MRKFNMQLITFVMSFNTVAMSACDCNVWYGSREVAHAVEDISLAAIHTPQYVSLNWWWEVSIKRLSSMNLQCTAATPNRNRFSTLPSSAAGEVLPIVQLSLWFQWYKS